MPLLAKCIATVAPLVYSIILGSCSHYFGGTILFHAKYIATVQLPLVVISGLFSHYFGGIIPL